MFYVGQAHNAAERVQAHRDGNGYRQARQRREFRLIFVEGPMEGIAALQRKRQLKKWSRA